ncbi:MAG: hypothetical protein LC795_11510 [Acidobacteria bacterium]|nr:hypothetical protein [Acidobacteriota bacterium]MCA1619917.1 hypothetical protein [Acidobacteriota bacterium]
MEPSRRRPQYPHLLADLLTRVLHRRQYLFRFAATPRPARPRRAAIGVRAFTLTITNPFRQRVNVAVPHLSRGAAAERPPRHVRL